MQSIAHLINWLASQHPVISVMATILLVAIGCVALVLAFASSCIAVNPQGGGKPCFKESQVTSVRIIATLVALAMLASTIVLFLMAQDLVMARVYN
jgi:hypothetical protein